jgi:Lrp/AsnC family transcriptional regulator for asnA, asnC and gidA
MGLSSQVRLDDIDRRIVAALLADGRTSAAKVSRALGGVSERAVRYRIQRLLDHEVMRVGAVVDPVAVGYELIADVFIEVAPGSLRSVAQRLADHPRVSYVAAAIGRGDLSIQVCARNAGELAGLVGELMASIPGVNTARTVLVPWKLKDVHQWRIPDEAPEGDVAGTR